MIWTQTLGFVKEIICSHPRQVHVRNIESHDGWQVGQHDQEKGKVPAKNAIITRLSIVSLLTRSLEDGDITILRLLWLCRGLDLMQGQHVWALSNIRVKELNAEVTISTS